MIAQIFYRLIGMLNFRKTCSIYLLLISVFLVITAGCNFNQEEISKISSVIPVNEETSGKKNDKIDSIIQTYRADLREEMESVLVYSAEIMKKGTPEGKLNNFVADLVFDKGKELYTPEDGKGIDFCLLNYGGLRVPIPKGEVTYGRVYELLPFENEMVVVTLSGNKTLELFQYLSNADRGMPVSGITLGIKNEKPEIIKINDKPFNVNRKYKILTSDYLAHGGDNMNFFLNPENYEILNMRVRDAIIMHMKDINKKNQQISAKLDSRIFVIND